MHVTVGVYKNNEYKYNIVLERDLENHIEYNKIFRFGRALFVDGKCVHQGYLSDEQIEDWTRKISGMRFDLSHPTIPYR